MIKVIMATETQRSYIKDLTVQRLKEFKEFKEMLYANDIVSRDAQTVANAQSVDAILDATTDEQASKMIAALLNKQIPVRNRTYSRKRSERVMELLDKVKKTANDWSYDELW